MLDALEMVRNIFLFLAWFAVLGAFLLAFSIFILLATGNLQ